MKTAPVLHHTRCKDCERDAIATICEDGIPYGYCYAHLEQRGLDGHLMQLGETVLAAALASLR